MRQYSKRKPTQRSRPASSQFALGGFTAFALLGCLVTLGCDVSPRDERTPAEDTTPGNQPDPELGAATEQLEAPPRPGASADDASRSTLAVAGDADAPEVVARAMLEPTEGNDVSGSVEFFEAAHGLQIAVSAMNLAPGTHGIHIHENGDCSAPDASSAGDHFTPADEPHGAPRDEPSAHHAGDLGNITADDSGNAEKKMEDPELNVEGEYGVVGRAVIVHAGEDDLTSQPSGESGDPVACGVVELVNVSTDRV